MIGLEIEIETHDAKMFLRGVRSEAIARASARALNKTVTTVRQRAVQEVAKVRRLKKTDIRKAMPIFRANRRQLEARIMGSRRTIPLKDYKAKLGGRKGAKHVVINVTGERKILRHAFISERRQGHVYEQKLGTSRIRRLHGPSIGSALVRGSTLNVLRQVIAERWPVVFEREVQFEIDRMSRR